MSVKNDSSILRNGGRSTSQISIYDYPEHLNPFYEAENHKRLRFWKIGKKKDGGSSRRGSFSLDGLRDLWSIKSFRLKKKSSTLGINKTSESPPTLRRDLDQNESSNYGTYDSRLRNTVPNNSFERNAPYRSSYQDVRSPSLLTEHHNGLGFGRNEMYRNTIQTPARRKRYENSHSSTPQNLTPLHRRYVYGGSVTPTPAIRNNKNCSYKFSEFNKISHGPSQLSVSSTNPFESGDDEESFIVNGITTSANPTPRKSGARKKRRAPQPPSAASQIPKLIVEDEITSQKSQNDDTTDNNDNIANLRNEIEMFLNKTAIEDGEEKDVIKIQGKTLQNDCNEIEPKNKTEIVVITTKKSSDSSKKPIITKRTYIPEQNKIVETNTTTVVTSPREMDEKFTILSVNSPVNSKDNIENIKTENSKEYQINKEVNNNDISDTEEDITCNENPKEIHEEVISKITNIEIKKDNIKNPNNNEEINKPISEMSDEFSNLNVELKITESVEDLSDKDKLNLMEKSNISSYEDQFEKYNVRFIPLKENSPLHNNYYSRSSPPPSSPPPPHTQISRPQVPVTRRRSVREIIASINRSQSLLKANNNHNGNNNNDNNSNDNDIEENNLNNNHSNFDLQQKPYDEIKIINNNTSFNEPNTVVFDKCTTFRSSESREQSPTTSNLDWNPLPKPKRTKKIASELVLSDDL